MAHLNTWFTTLTFKRWPAKECENIKKRKEKKVMPKLYPLIRRNWDEVYREDNSTPKLNKYGRMPYESKHKGIKITKFSFFKQNIQDSIEEFEKLINELYHLDFRFEYVMWAEDKDLSKYPYLKQSFRQIDLYVLFNLNKSPFFKDILNEFNIQMSVSKNTNFDSIDEAFEAIKEQTDCDVDDELLRIVKAEKVADDYTPSFTIGCEIEDPADEPEFGEPSWDDVEPPPLEYNDEFGGFSNLPPAEGDDEW